MALTFRYLNGGYYLQGEVDHSEIGFDDLDYVSVEPEVTITGYDSYGRYTGEAFYSLNNPSMLLPNFGGINEEVTASVNQLIQDYPESVSVKAQVYINGMGGSYYTIDAGTIAIGGESDIDPSAYPEGISSSDGYGYQYSPAVYYEAQSDEPEVKYFENTKLND